jgi:hypothetical protein
MVMPAYVFTSTQAGTTIERMRKKDEIAIAAVEGNRNTVSAKRFQSSSDRMID